MITAIDVELDNGLSIDGYAPPYRMEDPMPAAPRASITTWTGGTNSTGSKWYGGLGASGHSPIIDHYLTRQNARSAFHDNSTARAIVERFADSIVDRGLRLECTPKAETIGITDEMAERWAADVEARFDLWARAKTSTIDETMNFYQLQRLVEIFQQRDNDYFARLSYSDDPRLLNPLQIGMIDPNQVGVSGYTSSYGYNRQADGIERDENGREVSYDVTLQDKNYAIKMVKIAAVGATSGRRQMLHGWSAEYAGQGRGYSRLASAIQDFENLTDLSSSEIKKAIIQSTWAMYVKPGKDKPASNPLAGYVSGGSGPVVAQTMVEDETVEIPASLQYQTLPEMTHTVPGSGILLGLDNQEDLAPFPNTSPTAEYSRFVDSFCSYLCASMGMPIECLLMKFSANYSASRASLILFYRVCEMWRDEMAADFLNPIYEEWLTGEIAAGRIFAPGFFDPRLRAAWVSNNWVGTSMPNIDPNKTATAAETNLKLGLTTIDREARNLNGSSAKSNSAKLRREWADLPMSPYEKQKQTTAAPFDGAESEE